MQLLLFHSAMIFAVATALDDFQRARAKIPGEDFKGEDAAARSRVLNKHLLRSEDATRPCEEWNLHELLQCMASMEEYRSAELREIYEMTQDRRVGAVGTEAWLELAETAAKHQLDAPLLEAACREAVMVWTHQLTESSRAHLRSEQLVVPLMPSNTTEVRRRLAASQEERRLVTAIRATGNCAACHAGG